MDKIQEKKKESEDTYNCSRTNRLVLLHRVTNTIVVLLPKVALGTFGTAKRHHVAPDASRRAHGSGPAVFTARQVSGALSLVDRGSAERRARAHTATSRGNGVHGRLIARSRHCRVAARNKFNPLRILIDPPAAIFALRKHNCQFLVDGHRRK